MPDNVINITGSFTIGGATSNQPITSTQTVTVAPYSSPHHGFGLNSFYGNVYATDHSINTLKVLQYFGTGTFSGAAEGVHIENNLQTTTAATTADSNRIYTGITVTAGAEAEDNGTATTPRGMFYGIFSGVANNNDLATGAGATYPRALVGVRANAYTYAGTSPYIRVGLEAADYGSAVQAQATGYDAAISITALAGSIGWRNGILFAPTADTGFNYNYSPMNANATLIATSGPGTVVGGINWSSYTFTGNQLSGVGITIDQNGYIQSKGTAIKDNAAAGSVGEVMESTVPFASRVTLTPNMAADVAYIDLTAGDWDVWGNVAYNGNAATTTSYLAAYITMTSSTIPSPPNSGAYTDIRQAFTAGNFATLSAGTCRLSVAATTRVYLGAYSAFAINSMSAYGYIGARRAR